MVLASGRVRREADKTAHGRAQVARQETPKALEAGPPSAGSLEVRRVALSSPINSAAKLLK